MAKETIRKLIKDEPPTFMEVDYANRAINYLNAIIDLKTVGLSWNINESIAELKLDRQAVAALATINIPFAIRDASDADFVRVGVVPGTVNGIYPIFGGLPLDQQGTVPLGSATSPGPAGPTETKVLYLQAQVSAEADTYGDLVSVALLVGDEVPAPTFTAPTLRVGTLAIASSFDLVANATTRFIGSIQNDLLASVQLLRWYNNYIWIPGGVQA